MEKLRAIIGDVENENSDQIKLMERHSREVIQEAKGMVYCIYCKCMYVWYYMYM